MSSAVTGYTYTALNDASTEIRLLALERHKSDDETAPLSCSITTLSHAQAPGYFAISYAWGNPSELASITLDGHTVQVPAQTEAALRCLYAVKSRSEDFGRHDALHFWIDAVCINQADSDERSQQVAIMSDIYETAQEVLIYLGPAFDGCQDTTRYIKMAADRLTADCRNAVGLLEALEFNTRLPRVSFPVELDHHQLKLYFCSPWFTRLWVLQEALLGRTATAYYGSQGMPLTDAVIVARWVAKLQLSSGAYRDSSNSLVRNIDHCRKLWEWKCLNRCAQNLDHEEYCERGKCYGGFTLAWLLQHTHGQQHSEPVDAVYAILGLCHPEIAEQIVPDYSRPLTEVFSQATMVSIREHNVFAALRWARILGNKSDSWYADNQWPTWVPLWQERDNLSINSSGLPWWRFSAHGGTRADVHTAGARDQILVCKGYIVGRVGTVAPTFLPKSESSEDAAMHVQTMLRDYLPRVSQLERDYISPNAPATLGLTLAADYYPFVDADAEMGETHFGAFLQSRGLTHLFRQLDDSARLNVGNDVGDAERYLVQVNVHSRFRSLFFTCEGHMGLGPQYMKQDDLVCVALGSRVPWILREESDHFTLIGPCYVHGIMEGEFVRHALPFGSLVAFSIH